MFTAKCSCITSKESFLRKACENGELEEVKGFIEEGVDVDSRCPQLGNTPRACYGKVDIVRLLLDHGANIHSKSQNDYTALHQALWLRHEAADDDDKVVKLLIERGADLHAKSHDGTPLDEAKYYAKESNHSSAIALLDKIKTAIISTKGKND